MEFATLLCCCIGSPFSIVITSLGEEETGRFSIVITSLGEERSGLSSTVITSLGGMGIGDLALLCYC